RLRPGSFALHEVLQSAFAKRYLLAEPGVSHHHRHRYDDTGHADHGSAGSLVDANHYGVLSERCELLGHRRLWRHRPNRPQLRPDALADWLGPQHRRLRWKWQQFHQSRLYLSILQRFPRAAG